MPIEQLDVIPSRYRPSTFTPDMDAFLAWIQRNVPNYNALEQSLQMVATTGTSSSTLTVGTGVRNLTASPGRAWVVGAFVYVVHAASPANFMVGQITAYNSGTGALTLNVLRAAGSGTYGAWLIGLSGGDGTVVPRTGDTGLSGNYTTSGTWTGQHALPAENAYWSWNSVADSVIYNADANDFMQYSRLLDAWAWFVNGENRLYVDQYGPGRNDDASTPNGLTRKSQVDTLIAALNGRVDAIVPNSVAVLHGQIYHGSSLPLPAGYTEAQCRWIVSPHEYNAGFFDLQEGNAQQAPYFTCKVGAGRVVEAQIRFNIWGWQASWANYIVIGVK